MKKIYLKNWEINYKNQKIKATVPGDIHIDFYRAGLISNPYIAENYKDSTWVGRNDYIYKYNLEVKKDLFKHDIVNIVFKGIDIFSDIYVNHNLVGSTKNAFLKYVFDIKKYLKVGNNLIEVKMKSTLNIMDKIDTAGYSSIFNYPRIFVRKPQCHFGWDWAPKICAYGIIDDAYIEAKNKYQINDVQVIADMTGNTIFNVLLNYDNKDLKGPNDEVLKKGEPFANDTLEFYIAKSPFKEDYQLITIEMMGKKNFISFKLDNPELWWPNGYGKQPLYNYKIVLKRNNKVVDEVSGRYAYRSIKLVEEAKPNNLIGMDFYINDKKIFLKGSNFVPPECFTGVMKDDKYRELISLVKDMNANILRIWGGGTYEKDIFYDLCDENGILVWQDFAFACADIPEDHPEFLENFYEEAIYQVKRLRNHPSLIYWCGGNEKTGSYGNCISHGDFLVNYTLRGIVEHHDGTRPYRRQSPHSFTDIGNNPTSGDSHYGNFETALTIGMKNYRKEISKRITPFVSECAVLGPSSLETLTKIFPKDKLWPMNEMWKDRLMENPYSGINIDFPHREMFYAEDLYGKVKDINDFVMKAMCAQAESLRAESEYSRAHSHDITGAWLNWMFNDIWPSATWAILDYYLEPKQGYYQLRRSFVDVLVSFYLDNDGKTYLFINNQSNNVYTSKISYGIKTYDGKEIYTNDVNVKVNSLDTYKIALPKLRNDNNIYCFVKYKNPNGVKKLNLYSPTLYKDIKVENKFDYKFTIISNNEVNLAITAKSFVKSLFIHFKDNYKYRYSDNYLDLEKGETVNINIKSKDIIDVSKVKFNTLNN